MTAPALLDALAARGVVARVEDGDLKLRPACSLDAALLAEIRAAKAELLALLQAPGAPVTPCHVDDPMPLQDLKPSCSERTLYAPPSRSILCSAAYDPDAARTHALSMAPGAVRDYLLRCADGL
jgi:hypothetical protein